MTAAQISKEMINKCRDMCFTNKAGGAPLAIEGF
jgi:hypothetical protein